LPTLISCNFNSTRKMFVKIKDKKRG